MPLNLNLNTPDMTSNGNYEKRWKIIDSDRYLIKAGGKMINQEPFNEFTEVENKYEHYIRCLNNLKIKDVNLLVDKMIICDFILANKDRHFNNFGAIRNVETLGFEKVAPIFDNGCSLCFDENDMYVGEFFLTKPFEEYEKTQLSLVKKVSWLDINKLNGFAEEAREILLSNKLLSKDRVEKITEQIKSRIEFVSELIQTREENS